MTNRLVADEPVASVLWLVYLWPVFLWLCTLIWCMKCSTLCDVLCGVWRLEQSQEQGLNLTVTTPPNKHCGIKPPASPRFFFCLFVLILCSTTAFLIVFAGPRLLYIAPTRPFQNSTQREPPTNQSCRACSDSRASSRQLTTLGFVLVL